MISRPSCRRSGGLLLAQDLLGLSHKDAGSGSQANTGASDHQPPLRPLHVGMGVAAGLPGRIEHPPQHRGEARAAPTRGPVCCAHLPRHEPGHLLRRCVGRVLLGV